MKKGMKQLISGILVLCMVITMMPIVPAKAVNMVAITPNVSITDQLNSTGDVKYYSFTVDKSGYFDISLSVVDVTADVKQGWKVTLCDGTDGSEIYSGSIRRNRTLPKFNFAKGTKLFVKVEGDWNFDSAYVPIEVLYTLSINTVEDSNWEQEWNNSLKNADKIVGNNTYYGNLFYTLDKDYYSYTVTKDGYFDFDFGVEDVTADTKQGWKISIYDANNNEQLFSEDTKRSACYGNFNFKKGTKLYIVIEAAWNFDSAYVPRCVTYNFNMKETSSQYWEKESRVSASEAWGTRAKGATSIALGKTYTGNLWNSYDNDLYKVVAPKDGYVTFTMNPNDVSSNLGSGYRFNVLSGSGSTLYSVEAKTAQSKTLYLKKGTYYIEMSAAWSYSAPVLKNYLVSAKFRAATPGKILTINKSGAKVSWSKTSNVSGYQVAYSLRSNFRGAATKTTTKTFYNLSNLKKGSTYYVRVRSYKTTATGARVYGTWSSVVTVRR